MPHDVIMPALGMAQDTGLIVSWLKQQGDAVKTGDALMEVETDKAVVEVEALADGFLNDISAKAGDNVPVGQVIAVISNAATNQSATPENPTTQTAQVSDGNSIIMPALGMAQDTGKIVVWHKAPGDSVLADDVLLEVETDKSTMEVPAGHNGFVAALLAEAGQDVPVGDTIAVISADKPEAPLQQRAPTPVKPSHAADYDLTPEVAIPPIEKPTLAPALDGKILASPKAKRLALVQGLDLSRLQAKGHPQPYHVADLNILRSLPAEATNAQNNQMADQQICAVVPTSGTLEFIDRMLNDGGITIAPVALWANFAAAAFRTATKCDAPVIVELSPFEGPAICLADPDLERLSQQPESLQDTTPTFILRDFTGSPITRLRLGVKNVPVITIGSEGNSYKLSFDFTEIQLSETEAIDFITGFAARMNDPLHHLL